MQRTIRKFVLLFVLVCTVICCVAFVACNDDNNGNGGDGGDQKVTFSVTVTCDDDPALNFTTIRAKWLSGSKVKGEQALSADGTASIELEKGNYTVTLSGVKFGYSFENATVTGDNRDAEIAITKNIRSVPVTVNVPAGVVLSGVKVQIMKDEAEFGEPAVIFEGMVISVPKEGVYTVELTGMSKYDYLEKTVTINADSISIELTFKPVRYEVTVTSDDEEFDYTGVKVVISGGELNNKEYPLENNHKAGMDLTAGTYTVTLSGVDGSKYSFGSATLTIESRTATIKVKSKFVSLSVGGMVVLSFADANDEIIVKLQNVVAGQAYSIGLSSDVGDTEDDTADNLNKHNFYLNYNDQEYTLGKDRHDNNEDSYIIIEIAEGYNSFTIKADGAFDGAIITLEEYVEPIDTNISLGEDKLIPQSDTYSFTAPEYGTYKIEVSGATRTEFSINLGDGSVIGDGSENPYLYYEFYAEREQGFGISVYLNGIDSLTLKITRLPDGEFTLGEGKTVAIPSSYNEYVEHTFVAPVKGLYRLEVSGAPTSEFSVSISGKGTIIDNNASSSSGQFEAGLNESITFRFNNCKADASPDITVTITLLEVKDDVLVVGGTVSVGLIAGQGGKSIKVEGLTAGKEYAIEITNLQSILRAIGQSQVIITYNGQNYTLDANNDFNTKFTAVTGADTMTITLVGGGGKLDIEFGLTELSGTDANN